jgi:hypothetical protein
MVYVRVLQNRFNTIGIRINSSPSIICHYRVLSCMMYRMTEYSLDSVCGFFVTFHSDKNCFWHIKIFQKVAHLHILFCRISICLLSRIKFSLCRNGTRPTVLLCYVGNFIGIFLSNLIIDKTIFLETRLIYGKF